MRAIAVWLILAACTAQAEWQLFSEGEAGNKHYLDISTIKKTPNGYRVWAVIEYLSPSLGVLSSRSLDEYDCTEERYRSLQATHFSGLMGRGNIVGETKQTEWVYVPPGSVAEGKLTYICTRGKKR